MMNKLAGALLLTLLAAVPARSAEVPRLLADVNKKPLPPDLAEFPPLATGFFTLGDRLFFSTAGSFSGDDGVLWSTDGTTEGTKVVSSGICLSPCRQVVPVATLRGAVLLRAAQGSSYPDKVRYWRTDGTPAGTFPVTLELGFPSEEKLVPGLSPDTEIFYAAFNNGIVRIDGTEAGTGTVAGIDPDSFGSAPHSLAAWAGRLYFLTYGPDESGEPRFGLWSTDGTSEDARFIAEVKEHREDDALVVPTPSHLFFTSGEYGEDLWVTDGTPEGTRLLHDFTLRLPCVGHPRVCPVPTPDVSSMVAVGDAIYFSVQGENGRSTIWESDGTQGGTRPLTELPSGASPAMRTLQRLGGRWLFLAYSFEAPGNTAVGRIWTAGDGFSRPEPLTGCPEGSCPSVLSWFEGPDPGHLLFAGTDPAHGIELWITDGTGAGTRRLADACPGACNGLYFDGYSPLVLGSSQGRTWFLATPDPESSSELWVTDGTSTGTRRIAGHTAGVGFLDARAYFGLWGTDAYSSEVWTADGSRSGPRRVATLRRIPPGSDPVFVPLSDGGVLFDATEGQRSRLWRSDGTPEGTGLITGFRGLPYGGFTRVGGLYFFTVDRQDQDGYSLGTEIWRTDGTRSGTRKMITFGPDQLPATDVARAWNGQYLFPVTYFSSVNDLNDCSYWVSDGTPAGTREIVPRLPGVRLPTALHPFGSRFLFVARKEAKGGPVPQIFVSDGTPAGTLQLTNNRGTREPLETELVQLGRTAFFRIYGLDGGLDSQPEVWRTDGTPKGTRRAFDLKAAAHLQVFQGSLYLTAALDGPGARGLFRAEPDGPPVLLAPVSPPYEADFFGKPALIPMGGRLFFSGSDGEGEDDELWMTNGTAAGTKRVLDIRPGPGSSVPDGLTAAGDRVFFSADDGVHGRELWVSDGTAAGTRLVWDLNPGEPSSSPQSLVVSGGNLFFAADDGETGQEPWVLRLTPP